MPQIRRTIHDEDGFTLAETLVTLGLAAMLLATYFSVISGLIFLRRTQYEVQAAAFLQEQLEALRNLPLGTLAVRTDGRFLGTPVQRGGWAVQDVAGQQAMRIGTAQTATVEETGLMIAPGNYRENVTFTADIRADSSSPAGWGAGVVFGYRDAENHYRFRYTSGGIAMDRVLGGVRTTLWSQSVAHSTGTWYELQIIASSNSFTLRRDGVTLTTVADGSFASGDIGIIALNGALMAFDDVVVTEGGVTTVWNFDTDDVGTVPADWMRRSYADLPLGTGTLTITDVGGDAYLKSVTATMTWRDGLFTKSRSASTLITR